MKRLLTTLRRPGNSAKSDVLEAAFAAPQPERRLRGIEQRNASPPTAEPAQSGAGCDGGGGRPPIAENAPDGDDIPDDHVHAGTAEDGSPVYLPANCHWDISGASGSGKSAFVGYVLLQLIAELETSGPPNRR